ncbi:MAG: PTS sugar transporter subunit IIC [Clostridiales bacterium]|nr:PTS sugar transporter subunit IIC [Clostridiales bacterium]
MEKKSSYSFLERVKQICTRWFIDAFSGMAQGLFVTLIAGTIIKTIGSYLIGEDTVVGAFLALIGGIASVVTGFGIGVGMANALKGDKLVVYSAGVAGFIGAYADKLLGGAGLVELSAVWGKGLPGNPISAYVCALLAIEIARFVSGKTKLDILLVPLTCVACAIAGIYVSYPFIWLIGVIGEGIRIATTATPIIMGIVIAVVMGMLLTLPTSSAAIWVTIVTSFGQDVPDAVLIAGGAAVVGCASHMVGFAVMSFRENGFSGLISQGLGTSMLQIPNVMKKPILFIPPVISSIITGPLATKVFQLRCNASGGGMGTSGLVGVFGVIDASAGKIESWVLWLGIALLMFILPAVICFFVSEFMRKKGWIKEGDLKLK